ncbi:hypothetical protein BH09MYX1_BH09MYX1_65230 [soil metagenome]
MKAPWICVLALALYACGSTKGLDDGRHPATCAESTVVNCGCRDGSQGQQTCLASGVWGACSCDASDASVAETSTSLDAALPPLPFTIDDPSRCLKGGTRFYSFAQKARPTEVEIVGLDFYPPPPLPENRLTFYLDKSGWQLDFETEELDEPILVKRYDDVECAGAATYMKAGFHVSNSSFDCHRGHITVVVHELVYTADVERVTITFEEGDHDGTGKKIGCFHYEK